MNDPKPRIKCLTPGCDIDNYARGLCRWHYQIAWKLIKRGSTAWSKLIAAGKARPSKPDRFKVEAKAMTRGV